MDRHERLLLAEARANFAPVYLPRPRKKPQPQSPSPAPSARGVYRRSTDQGSIAYSRGDLARARLAYPFLYQEPFNESQHPRAAAGQPTGGQFVAADHGASPTQTTPTDRPHASGEIQDRRGAFVGRFNVQTGWVKRSVKKGGLKSDRPIEPAVAEIDDVIKALWDSKGPRTDEEWNEWFIREGQPRIGAPPQAPGYSNRGVLSPEDAVIPQGTLRSGSGFDADGNPRLASATMAGPIVTRLIVHVLSGLVEEYGGGHVLGLVISRTGKLAVRVLKNGKEVIQELTERTTKRFRKSVDDSAVGDQAKKWLKDAKPGARLDFDITGPKGKYRGGRHGDTRFPTGDGLESHHMPSAAASSDYHGRNDGPAIQMDPADHRQTMSHGSVPGSNTYRDLQQGHIKRGEFGKAIQMDIDDIRAKFNNKYDEAIFEMLESLEPSMRIGLKNPPF